MQICFFKNYLVLYFSKAPVLFPIGKIYWHWNCIYHVWILFAFSCFSLQTLLPSFFSPFLGFTSIDKSSHSVSLFLIRNMEHQDIVSKQLRDTLECSHRVIRKEKRLVVTTYLLILTVDSHIMNIWTLMMFTHVVEGFLHIRGVHKLKAH